ncbi:MAG: hypothetical protein AB7I04_12865 [Pseudomonadales bacterium]
MSRSSLPKAKKESFFSRLNRALTEVGIEHFDDDRDWDARVKLPEWQLARLKRRYEERKARGRLGSDQPSDPGTAE